MASSKSCGQTAWVRCDVRFGSEADVMAVRLIGPLRAISGCRCAAPTAPDYSETFG